MDKLTLTTPQAVVEELLDESRNILVIEMHNEKGKLMTLTLGLPATMDTVQVAERIKELIETDIIKQRTLLG